MSGATSGIGDFWNHLAESKQPDKFLEGSPKYTIPAIAALLGYNAMGGGGMMGGSTGGDPAIIQAGQASPAAGAAGGPGMANWMQYASMIPRSSPPPQAPPQQQTATPTWPMTTPFSVYGRY